MDVKECEGALLLLPRDCVLLIYDYLKAKKKKMQKKKKNKKKKNVK